MQITAPGRAIGAPTRQGIHTLELRQLPVGHGLPHALDASASKELTVDIGGHPDPGDRSAPFMDHRRHLMARRPKSP